MAARKASWIALEFALALGASALMHTLGTRLLEQYGMLLVGFGLAGMLSVMVFLWYALPFGGPALIALFGLWRRRIGCVLGPAAFVLGLYLHSGSLMRQHEVVAAQTEGRAIKFDQRVFQPLKATHAVIAFDGGTSCNTLCIQILAQTHYAFAAKRYRMNEGWDIYRRLEGERCLAPENRASYLQFLATGYVGMCATQASWSPGEDAIYVFGTDSQPGKWPEIGEHFRGDVMTAHERSRGRDRLLGRWVYGNIEPPRGTFDPLSRRTYERVGTDFAAEDFFAALLGVPIAESAHPGAADRDQLLTELEQLLDDSKIGRHARNIYESFAIELAYTDRPLVRKHLERLLATGQPEHMIAVFHIFVGRSNWPAAELEFMSPYIEASLRSSDMELAQAALAATHNFKEQRTRFDSAIIEIAFSSALSEDHAMQGASLPGRLMAMPGVFDPALRQRAADMIRADPGLSQSHAFTLLVIVADGGEEARREAFDLVQTFEGHKFQELIAAINQYGWKKLSGTENNRWNDRELRVIVDRIKDVPDNELQDYLNAFTHARRLEQPYKDEVIAELERRLAAQGPKRDSILERYVRDLKQ